MKKFKKFTLKSFMVMAVAASFFAFASCTDDENGGSGSGGFSANDPEGTVIVNMLFEETTLVLIDFGPHQGEAARVKLDNAANFCRYSGNPVEIVNVGNVAGIGAITENDIERSGYSTKCVAMLGHGYIFRVPPYDSSPNYTYLGYVRLYVDNWIKNSSGGIIGAVIKYQDNWITYYQ